MGRLVINPKISIIIPVYNVEKYIERAFNSLLNQTLSFNNLEIIFIDDCSIDNSKNILQNYQETYDNVKAVFLDKNSGSAGKPRNIGLNYATCDYVMFLDSDDTFMDDACEVLFNEITKENVDIVSGVHTWDGTNPSPGLWQSILTNPTDSHQVRQNNVDDILKNFPLKINSIDECESVIGDFAFTPKIYRKSFLERNSIKFPEGIIVEDSVFLLNALLNANGIKYVNKIVYYYYHERTGDSNPSMSYIYSKKNLKGLLDSIYKMYYISLKKGKSEIFKKYLLYQKLLYFLNSKLLKSNLSVMDVLELLIDAQPLFSLYVGFDKEVDNNLFKYIADKDYENALKVIFGKDVKKIGDINCNSLEVDIDLFIYNPNNELNEIIFNHCIESDIPTVFLDDGSDVEIKNKFDYIVDYNLEFRQILDAIDFKYIPYLKHIVFFYQLDGLKDLVNIQNHFHSINYPYKHIKLITSKENLFLSNSILKSDLKNINLDKNYHFCFVDLDLKQDIDIDDLGVNVSEYKNVIFDFSKFREVISLHMISPVISVIVPVYNVENYLEECLDSICNQTFRNIEIICVNDGSTDGSLNILKEYQNHDSRIKIISQENNGLAVARNTGLKHAKGKYVYFLDSDDYIDLNALEECYNISEENNLDMLIFKIISFWDDTRETFTTPYFEMDFLKELVGDNVFNYMDLGKKMYDLAVTVPGVLFKRDLILNLRFPDNLIFEDNVFFTEAVFRVNRILFYNKHLYYYRMRKESITNSGSNFSDIIEIRNMIIDLAKKYDNFDPYLYSKKLNLIVYRFLQVSYENKEDFFSKIQKDFAEHKEEYESSEEFNNLPVEQKSIFYAGLNSKNYIEFEDALNRKIKISVIIPVYNKQNYISETLESIENQTLNNIEVICIDDGSTDNSLDIIENFINSSFKLEILKQNNLGPGIARNNALEVAKGEYVSFLDADDLYEDPQSLEKMYNLAKSSNADMVSANLNRGDAKERRYKSYYTKFYEKQTVINPDDYEVPFYFYKNIFKNSFLQENEIKFPNLEMGEDPVFLAEILSKLDEIPCLPLDFYYYRISETPGIDKVNTPQKKYDYIKHFKDTLIILKDAGYAQMFENYVDLLVEFISHPNYNSDLDVYNAFNGEFEDFPEIFDKYISLFSISNIE